MQHGIRWLVVGAVGVVVALTAQSATLAQQPAVAQQEPEQRRELITALASLANIPAQELRVAARDIGGIVPALESLGVTREQVLETLTEFALRRYEPAIAEGRLSPDQARQLAQNQARRLYRQLGGTPPRGR